MSLPGFASSAHNLATGEFGRDFFRLDRFDINVNDILVK